MSHASSEKMADTGDADLLRRTLRTMAILVASCVMFVGALSLLAVLLTSKALGPAAKAAADTEHTETSKKPLSI